MQIVSLLHQFQSMLYFLLSSLVPDLSILNVFKYITFRAILAFITSLLLCFALGEKFIVRFGAWQKGGQPIRLDGPETHISKKGTPTMGGVMILISMLLAVLAWMDWMNPFVWIVLGVTMSFGALGLMDDYLKVSKHNTTGVPGRIKLLWQFFTSFLAVYFISCYTPNVVDKSVHFPFFKDFTIYLGVLYFIFAAFVITGASNAVNLTDGLDGLATGPVIMAFACYAIICYVVGNVVFAQYLQIPFIAGTGELMVVCAAFIGACLGFLWYNAPPAQIFMGDVGSLALGGALGIISVIVKHEVLLSIIGGLFVIEALSVMIQVFCFKKWGKRPFRMAPIHHHFEKLGWSETKVMMRFWIIAVIFAVVGLATLKLR
jgi:phospho-N-acetylmuramoyl-pentapeptide-transferase